jgi:hypothetical protein
MWKSAQLAALILIVGCGGRSVASVEEARATTYRAPLDAILQATAAAVAAEYKRSVITPDERLIQTPWFQLPLTEHVTTREEDKGAGSPTMGDRPIDPDHYHQRREFRKRMTDRTMRYFVRFDVRLVPVTGPPDFEDATWKVRIDGFASKWDGTAMPEPLKGAETPYWLAERIDKLQVAIHQRLESMGFKPAPEPEPKSAPAPDAPDPLRTP